MDSRGMTEPYEHQSLAASENFGTLVPKGGGDPIPLLKKNLLIGRRESCDIVLRFKNVSAHHCQLSVRGGYWYVKDMKSLNGVKVNDVSITDRRLQSGDTLTIAKHSYRIYYVPADLGAVGPPPPDAPPEEILVTRCSNERDLSSRQEGNAKKRKSIDQPKSPPPETNS